MLLSVTKTMLKILKADWNTSSSRLAAALIKSEFKEAKMQDRNLEIDVMMRHQLAWDCWLQCKSVLVRSHLKIFKQACN